MNDLGYWLEALTGLSRDRHHAACERIRRWAIPHVTQTLVNTADLDAAAGAVLLAESVVSLASHGIDERRLLKKLRDDRDVWPAWAELRAASVLISPPNVDVRLRLEPGRHHGAHPDFWYSSTIFPDGIRIEFKAIGLSNHEARFCGEHRDLLLHACPPLGFITLHTKIGNKLRRLSADDLVMMTADANARLAALPAALRSLSGVSVVAHGAEPGYLARLWDRFHDALAQVRDDGTTTPCLVAFHWSNGAPVVEAARMLASPPPPKNVKGIVFIGSAVVVPRPALHTFQLVAPIDASLSAEDKAKVYSTVDPELAGVISEDLQACVGVRATLLRAAGDGGAPLDLVIRDGTRPITPFNLLLDLDPNWTAPNVRRPPWLPVRS